MSDYGSLSGYYRDCRYNFIAITLSTGLHAEYFLMAFFGYLVVGLYFLGKVADRLRPHSV